jgi:hypothetical protein
MSGNAAAMLGSGFRLGKQQKRFYYFALAALVVNTILTLTDEYGIFDFITLIIDAGLWGLLIADRKRYSHPSSRVVQEI